MTIIEDVSDTSRGFESSDNQKATLSLQDDEDLHQNGWRPWVISFSKIFVVLGLIEVPLGSFVSDVFSNDGFYIGVWWSGLIVFASGDHSSLHVEVFDGILFVVIHGQSRQYLPISAKIWDLTNLKEYLDITRQQNVEPVYFYVFSFLEGRWLWAGEDTYVAVYMTSFHENNMIDFSSSFVAGMIDAFAAGNARSSAACGFEYSAPYSGRYFVGNTVDYKNVTSCMDQRDRDGYQLDGTCVCTDHREGGCKTFKLSPSSVRSGLDCSVVFTSFANVAFSSSAVCFVTALLFLPPVIACWQILEKRHVPLPDNGNPSS